MLEYIMQGCDVAEADEPFGVLAKLGEVELPCQMHSAVSAAAAKDDFGFLVVHSFLQVFQSLLYASCIGSMCTSCMFGDDHFQSPMTSAVSWPFQEGLVYLAGRREDYHPVSLMHVWRKNEAVHIDISVFMAKST